jgi:carboxypeptidase Taq
MIGRSQAFWEFLFPQMQAVFPSQLGSVSAQDVWKEANSIKPSLIRVDADEVTYHLHIMIRSEIECALVEGTLDPKDASDAWNAAYKKYLNVDVPDAAHGILQDIHWSQGLIGYFPTYSMGTMLAAQLFATLQQQKPTIEEDIRAGKFEIPLKWLNHEIHQYARIYSSNEVSTRITGSAVTANALVAHIKEKFSI